MTITLRFGSKNKRGKAEDFIYIRIKHSNLDWDKSLKIKVKESDWNFKKSEVITYKPINNPMETERLKEVSQRLISIHSTLKYKAEDFLSTNPQDIAKWVREKDRKSFQNMCTDWYMSYLDDVKVPVQPFITDIIQNYIDNKYSRVELKVKKHSDRKLRLTNLNKNIKGFELFWKKRIRANELSQQFWKNEIVPFLIEDYEKGILTDSVTKDGKKREYTGIGLKDHTINTIRQLIHTSVNETTGVNFHHDLVKNRLKHEFEAPSKIILDKEQIKSILEFNDHDLIYDLDKKLWFYKVMFYGCFRINEVFETFKGKTPEYIWKNNISVLKNKKGENVYHLECANFKQKKFHSKKVPMANELGNILFGGFDKAEQGIFPISFPHFHDPNTYRKALRKICKAVNIKGQITPHSLRRSFLNHLRGQDLTFADLMQYSGHQTESALLHYLGKDFNVPTGANLDNVI